MKIKKLFIAAALAVMSALCLPEKASAQWVPQPIIPAGTTNIVPQVSTNYLSAGMGTSIANASGYVVSAVNSKDLFVSLTFNMMGPNTSTNTLYVDNAVLVGTNGIQTNGYWNFGVFSTNIVANGTQPVTVTFNIGNSNPGGGAPFYAFRLANTNGVGNANGVISNIVFQAGSKVGL